MDVHGLTILPVYIHLMTRRAVLVVEALPYYIHLISNEVYSLILLSKILDLEADDLSLHIISSDTELKTTKSGEDNLSPVV